MTTAQLKLRPTCADDVRGADAELVQHLFRFAAARNLADGKPGHRHAFGAHRLRHRIADPAGRVVILHGHNPVARLPR